MPWSIQPIDKTRFQTKFSGFDSNCHTGKSALFTFFCAAPTSTKMNVVKWACFAKRSLNTQQKDENHWRHFHFLHTWKTLVDKQRENQGRQTRQRGGDSRRKGDREREFW